MRVEQSELERIPSAFRAYSEKYALRRCACDGLCRAGRRSRVGDQAQSDGKEARQLILDEHAKLLVDGNGGHTSVAHLREAFDEACTIERLCEDVSVEVMTFDAL